MYALIFLTKTIFSSYMSHKKNKEFNSCAILLIFIYKSLIYFLVRIETMVFVASKAHVNWMEKYYY